MSNVKADLVTDLFTLEFSGDPLPADALAAAVKSVSDSYDARVVTAQEADQIVKAVPTPPPMPEFVQKAIDQARKEGKLVAFDCYAEWCAPCMKMLKEVFPRQDVQKILNEHFILVKVDVDRQVEAAQWFRSPGIPDL